MTKPKVSCFKQFRGCLIKQCLEDAVGYPVEGYAEEVCQNNVNYDLKVINSVLWNLDSFLKTPEDY